MAWLCGRIIMVLRVYGRIFIAARPRPSSRYRRLDHEVVRSRPDLNPKREYVGTAGFAIPRTFPKPRCKSCEGIHVLGIGVIVPVEVLLWI
jgi:hypothetical protein